MQLEYQDFVDTYTQSQDVDLLELYVGKDDLLPAAREALLAEMARRKLDLKSAAETVRAERPQAWETPTGIAVLRSPVIIPKICVVCSSQDAGKVIVFRKNSFFLNALILRLAHFLFSKKFRFYCCDECAKKIRRAKILRPTIILGFILVWVAFLFLFQALNQLTLWVALLSSPFFFIAAIMLIRRHVAGILTAVRIGRTWDLATLFQFQNAGYQSIFLDANR